MDKSGVAQDFVILIIGVVDRPMPSIYHLQKELFVFSKAKASLQDLFNYDKHYYGPFSRLVYEVATENSLYVDKPFVFNGDQILLSASGKKRFNELISEHSKDEKFQMILQSLKMLRELYDKFSWEELIFIMYETYPEFIEYSEYYCKISTERKEIILKNLLRKKLITENRYKELHNEKRKTNC